MQLSPVQFTQEPWKDQQTDFEDSGLHDVLETSRNRFLKKLGKFKSPEKNFIVAETQGNEGQMGKKVHKVGYEACMYYSPMNREQL